MKFQFARTGIFTALALFALALPGFAQQEAGDKEVNAAGTIAIPHSSPSDTFALFNLRLGYYPNGNNLVGVDTTTFLHKDAKAVLLSGFYRYLISTANPKVFPFLGFSAGTIIVSTGDTDSRFSARGEFGIRYFVSQKVAFDTAYNLIYVREAGAGFKDSTASVITFGFSYLF